MTRHQSSVLLSNLASSSQIPNERFRARSLPGRGDSTGPTERQETSPGEPKDFDLASVPRSPDEIRQLDEVWTPDSEFSQHVDCARDFDVGLSQGAASSEDEGLCHQSSTSHHDSTAPCDFRPHAQLHDREYADAGRECQPRPSCESREASVPPAKKLKTVPRNAPRSIEKVARYTFRRGVRIGDYKMPKPTANPPWPDSWSYQCRDGFEGSETSPKWPRLHTE